MNIWSIFGLVIAFGIVFVGLTLATDDIGLFVNYPSMFIVLGGTLGATAISFQLDRIVVLMKVFITRLLTAHRIRYSNIIKELMSIGEAYRNGEDLGSLSKKSKDLFLQEGLQMLSEGVLDADHVIDILEKRSEHILHNNLTEANKIKTLGKFPPAFGMMGTTIGMIVLLSNLGGDNAMEMIGPAMGLCLITTLYGLIFSNVLLVPASENLIAQSHERYLKNNIVIEGMKLIIKKTNPIIVAEELNSYLSPGDRLDWRSISKKK